MKIKESGRSWIVLAVATFAMFLEAGAVKGLSVLLPEIQKQFDTHTWIVGSSIALMTGFGYLSGLTAGVFVKYIKPRTGIVISGFLAGVGLILASMSTGPMTLLIGLLLAGFLLVQETFVMGVIPDYFDKYLTVAVGIYSSGTACGILILPLVTQSLIDTYGWRGTLLHLSGLVLHSVPFGLLVKFPDRYRLKENKTLLNTNTGINVNKIEYIRSTISNALGIPMIARLGFVTDVFIPAFSLGYNLTGWMIYMIPYAISNGASLKEGTIVVTCGGLGCFVSRALVTPVLHYYMTCRHQLYVSSLAMVLSFVLLTISKSFLGMCILSTLFGVAIGLFGTEVLISAGINCKESENIQAMAWVNFAYGIAAISSGFITGFIAEFTGSFTVSFYILAAVSMSPIISLGINDSFGRRTVMM